LSADVDPRPDGIRETGREKGREKGREREREGGRKRQTERKSAGGNGHRMKKQNGSCRITWACTYVYRQPSWRFKGFPRGSLSPRMGITESFIYVVLHNRACGDDACREALQGRSHERRGRGFFALSAFVYAEALRREEGIYRKRLIARA